MCKVLIRMLGRYQVLDGNFNGNKRQEEEDEFGFRLCELKGPATLPDKKMEVY